MILTLIIKITVQIIYLDIVSNESKFKEFVNNEYEKYPESFPVNFSDGYVLHGQYHSGSSFDAVANNYGKNAMFWYRLFISLGKYSIVGIFGR